MSRPVPQCAVDLVKSFEGCELLAYPDPGTGGAPWTIGYGCTGPNIFKGLTITQDDAEEWLVADLQKAGDTVLRFTGAVGLTDNQYGALISFVYNVGGGNFATSTLLTHVKAGEFDAAAGEFGKWNHAAGRVLPGLTARRAAEAELFSA